MHNKLPIRLISRKNKSPIEFSPQTSHFRKDVLTIIQYWNSSWGLCQHPLPESPSDIPTKRILRIIKTIGEVLDGKFLQTWPTYSVQDILRAIDGFKLRATNPDYVPANKTGIKKTSLDTFFWNPYVSNPNQSMFLECLNNEPQLLQNIVPRTKELNPQMTKWLQELYITKILSGQSRTFNPIETNKFIRGANQLADSMKELRQRANLLTGPYEFCEYVIDSLIGAFGQAGITPGHVASAWTYRDCLPKYLSQIGRID
jgi:hypothetical protein